MEQPGPNENDPEESENQSKIDISALEMYTNTIELAHSLREHSSELFQFEKLGDRGTYHSRRNTDYELGRITKALSDFPLAAFSNQILEESFNQLRVLAPAESIEEAERIVEQLRNIVGRLEQSGRDYRIGIRNSTHDDIEYLSRRIMDLRDQMSTISESGLYAETLIKDLAKKQSETNSLTKNLSKHVADFEAHEQRIAKYLKQIDDLFAGLKNKDLAFAQLEIDLSKSKEKFETFEDRINETNDAIIDILGKKESVNTLLDTAEKAVGLKATEGISAAFISERDKSQKSLDYWLKATYFFLIGAVLSTTWILGGWFISDPTSWPSIVGRIAVVGIMIGGATFCSKQYVRQKSIADDYTYKAVLSQSIIAFSDQIKNRNDSQVVEYLKQVLAEIHKDPQRPRKTISNSELKIEIMEMMNKVVEKVAAAK